MTIKDGKPCVRCGTSKWNNGGHCVKCRKKYDREYHQKNKEKRNAQNRQYYKDNKAQELTRVRKWQQENPEKRREICNRWYKNNKVQAIASSRQWKANNREKDRARWRTWVKNNRGKRRAAKQRRRAREVNAEGAFTATQFRRLCKRYGNKCLCCGRDDLELTPDHVIPLSRGGSNLIENIQPLCLLCNMKKHIKTTDYRTRPIPKRWTQPKLFEEQS